MMKKSISAIAIALSIMMLTGCNSGKVAKDTISKMPTPDPKLVKSAVTATIEIEDYDDIVLELYPDLAPETVENFVSLANDGFYDGTIFHRVIDGFMIQGGGYNESLTEQKTSSIKGEFDANGFENTLSHTRGVISMARTAVNMDSASSQFFIVQQDSPHLDGQYAAFGKVTEGIEVVDEIASVKTGSAASAGMNDVPVKPIVIESIIIGDGSAKKSKKATPAPTASAKPTSSPKADDADSDDDDNSSSTLS